MTRHLRLLLIAGALVSTFSACNKVPDHAKLIPRDALSVIGINTAKLGKQVAWSALAGSQLFKDMRQKLPGNAMVNDLEDAGIKKISVSYVYARSIPGTGQQLTALIPLNNRKKWEDYVHKVFPAAVIKDAGKRQEAYLMEGVCAGWNNELLVVVGVIKSEKPQEEKQVVINETDTTAADTVTIAVIAPPDTSSGFEKHLVTDVAALSARVSEAFEIKGENSLMEDARFKKLQNADHGVSFWVNYEPLMAENKDRLAGMGGLSLPGTLWKDAALAAGVDFEKGKIAGDMYYYSPEGLREATKQFGSISADKVMIERLPARNLNMMMSMHLEPSGIKMMLDKIGVLGFVNLALMGNNLNVDDILESFTGDMAVSLNNLRASQVTDMTAADDSTQTFYSSRKTTMDFVYTIKINNREKFKKLFQMAESSGALTPYGNNIYLSKATVNDSTFLIKNDDYVVISSSSAAGLAFLNGTNKDQELPEPAKAVYNHPFGLYVDFQSILGGLQAGASPKDYVDSVALGEGRRKFRNLVLTGGDYKNNALSYHLEMNFVDKEENSLIQLMDLAMKMNDARVQASLLKQHSAQQAFNTPTAPVPVQ